MKMQKIKIYLDNAATSFPKPRPVVDAMVEYLEHAGNPGRGAHAASLYGARRIMEARQEIAAFFGIKTEERLIFTPGCTASLNQVIKSVLGDAASGDCVITSGMEHNAVTRPVEQMVAARGIEHIALNPDKNGLLDLSELKDILAEKHKKIRLCAIVAASNVTGLVLPFEAAASLCKEYNVPCLVDGAQIAGKLPLNLSGTDISFFCASGHKGLPGPPGVGLLYIAPDFDLRPLIAGGTGSGSESYDIPAFYPDRLEAGTMPGHDIHALAAAVKWLQEKGPEALLKQELALCNAFLDWALGQNNIEIVGISTGENAAGDNPFRMPLVSFSVKAISPQILADQLDTRYSIPVRAGLHCAAQAHRSLGTIDSGLCRVSFGPQNTLSDLEALVDALRAIIESV